MDLFTAEAFDSQHFRIAVPVVTAASYTFFMCHGTGLLFQALIETISNLVYC